MSLRLQHNLVSSFLFSLNEYFLLQCCSSFEKKMSKSLSFSVGLRELILKTTVVTDESELKQELQLLLSAIDNQQYGTMGKFNRVVGLDIEKSFRYNIDGSYTEKVAVLKLCTGNHCLIVHLFHFKTKPISLLRFLDVSDITVIGVGIKQNLCDLQSDYGIQCRNSVVELADYAAAVKKNPMLGSFCLVDLCKYIFQNSSWYYRLYRSVVKSAEIAFGDWGTNVLSDEQIRHASKDVFVTLMVADELFKIEAGRNVE